MFTGGSTSQCVKLWDVRNRQCIYELSTGNNVVYSLAWNAENATLYAATECQYVDRMGNYHSDDYRKVHTTADDEDDYDERHWPNRATHDETSFGYVFDIGEHALCKRYYYATVTQLSNQIQSNTPLRRTRIQILFLPTGRPSPREAGKSEIQVLGVNISCNNVSVVRQCLYENNNSLP